MIELDRYLGCMLGGAIGDALGYPVEFMSRTEICQKYGPHGITELQTDPRSGKALISDDTQMALFTANGLLLYQNGVDTSFARCMRIAYQRWYHTQGGFVAESWMLRPLARDPLPFILDQGELFARRAPGNTCLSALAADFNRPVKGPINDSKGCGGVMRVAPCGLLFSGSPGRAYAAGVQAAVITHGHPTGYTAAGALAYMIAEIVNDAPDADKADPKQRLRDAVAATQSRLQRRPETAGEVMAALAHAVVYADCFGPATAIPRLGEGWVAEEALAIAIYCALRADSPEEALRMAVNHNGDSDSTGAICGNLVGAMYGADALPGRWVTDVELREYIKLVTTMLYQAARRRIAGGYDHAIEN